jgi:uncharacterized membrane protein HdeD (DUF308 family)
MNEMNPTDPSFPNTLSRHWWLVALRGVIAILFGILAFVWPGITLLTLVYLFGVYAVSNGVLALVHAFSAPKGYPRFGALIFTGLVSIVAGVLAFIWPGITALSLVLLIAGWAIVNGVFEIATAVRLRRVMRHEWALILAGVFSVLLGLIIAIQPAAGALGLLWWIGSFAILFGALLIVLAFRLRREGSAAGFASAVM